jgi:glutathione S-transferase
MKEAAMLTISNFARGARGLRAMWLCEEMGIAYRAVLLPYPVPPEYRARNPLGQAPFLEDGDVAITESASMLLYLAQTYGPTPLLPSPGSAAYPRVMQMTVFGEATLGGAVSALLMDKFAVPDAEKNGALPRMFRGRAEQALDFAAHLLGEGPYFAAERFTIADISMSTAFSLWRGPLGGALPDALEAYQDRVTARPAYLRAAAANGEG